MKTLVLWADSASTNLGVRALAEGSAALVERAVPGGEFAFQGFGAGSAPVRIGDWKPHAKRLLSRRDVLIDWVRGFDLVVDTRAGDSFADIYGQRRLATMGLMAEVVRRAGVPLVLGPQTVGPFGTRRGRGWAKRSLSTAAVVMARDGVSAAHAAQLGRPVDLLTSDVVFELPSAAVERRRDVVVNVSGLLWDRNAHVDHDRYREVVRDLVRGLQQRGRTPSLLAHVLPSALADNDIPANQALAAELGGDLEVIVPQDLQDVRQVLAGAEVVVGSRMHACLNALSLGRPAIPLAYSRKFAPLLEQVSWSATVDLRDGVDQAARVLTALDDPTLGERAAAVAERAREQLEPAAGLIVRAVERGRRR